MTLMAKLNKCYRVWYSDDTAILVDAPTKDAARKEGERLCSPNTARVTKIECLTDGGS